MATMPRKRRWPRRWCTHCARAVCRAAAAAPGVRARRPETSAYGRTRSLGPLEYLCAWHAQADPARVLTAEQFHVAARALMDLIGCSGEARLLYCEKLLADVGDPIGGALSRGTRDALRALATAWSEGASSFDASARFLSSLQRPREGSGLLAAAALR